MTFWIRLKATGAMVLAVGVLAGCGSFVRSNVTAFHQWPAQLQNTTFVFERSREQDASLEYRNYEDLVRKELNRLGLREAAPNATPQLKTRLQFGISVRDVREVYPVVVHPYWHSPGWRMRSRVHPDPFYDPFFDPYWYGPAVVQQRESSYQIFTRQLRVTIARFADNTPLWDATVVSEGGQGSLANVMPYLVRSAFKDFPGPSGVTRQVEMKVD